MVIVAAALALAGCAEKPKIEECWSEEAKTVLKKLVADGVIKQIKSEDQTGRLDEQQLRKALKIELGAFMAADRNSIGVLQCGADATSTLTRDDGLVLKGGPFPFTFGIYPAEEKGPLYVIPNGLAFNSLIRDMQQSASRGGEASGAK
ncbi:hypothetical protein [Chromobacterium subtsugae]|uniref:hypothetical protein n=1 Tax=Chromobacterium subtsugae TaxID=251747 RepID=UPI0012FFD1A5|nr:hypothetical protein [Chromobacterium subtsugae]